MIIEDIINELEIELIAISTQKRPIEKAQKKILEALNQYLEAKNIDLKDYIDIENYKKFVEVTAPKDKNQTTQTELKA